MVYERTNGGRLLYAGGRLTSEGERYMRQFEAARIAQRQEFGKTIEQVVLNEPADVPIPVGADN